MRNQATIQECMDKHRKEGKAVVINDGIVIRFERESEGRAMAHVQEELEE